jgi:putative transcriptional regulator
VSHYTIQALQKSQISLPARAFGQKQDMLLIIRIKWINLHKTLIIMSNKAINRLKVVLVEKNRSNKWLAEQLNKNETTVSRWCTNDTQPSVDTLSQIAELLDVDIRDLLSSTKNDNR